jgi:addiction module RelB/DinJ family antitoxin
MAQVNIRMDDDLKLQAESFFDELGMSMTTAFMIFVKQTLRDKRIPFTIAVNEEYRPKTGHETSPEPTDIKDKLLSMAGTFDEEDYQDFMEALKDCR